MDFIGVIDPAPEWADVPQMTTEAILLGGSGGAMNGHALALAKRTKYLKADLDVVHSASGSLHVGYQPDGTGAVQRSVEVKLHEFVSVKDFGAVGDGVADDTSSVQAAITATRMQGGIKSKLKWVAGTYKITSTLTLGSYQYIEFDPGVVINLVPASNVETTSLFGVGNQTSVTMIGNGCIINGTRTGAVIEGNAAAFYFYGTNGVHVSRFNINGFATDGITLTGDNGASGPCINCTIIDINVDNCRRNGLSIIHGKNIKVIGGRYTNSNGAPSGPWAGIDVEPNGTQTIENVSIRDVYTSGNPGGGLLFVPLGSSTSGIGRYEVRVTGGKSFSDGDIYGRAGIRFINGANLANKCIGYISVRDFTVDSPLSNGANFLNWDADKAPKVILQNVTVINPDSTSVITNNDAKTGFEIYHATTDAAPTMGNIVMNDCSAVDTRGASARMPWGVRLMADAGRQIKNVYIKDQSTYGATSTVPVDVLASAEGVSSGMNGVNVEASIPKLSGISSSTSLSGYIGRRINVTSNGTNQTLPLAGNCFGRTIEIQNGSGVNSTQVLPQTGDTIGWPINVSNTAIVLDEGGYIRLRSLGGTTWEIESLCGRWRQQGMSKATRTVFKASAPTTGSWEVGDIVINATPSVGAAKGWRCTVSGTPGTWVSEGNL